MLPNSPYTLNILHFEDRIESNNVISFPINQAFAAKFTIGIDVHAENY